MSAAASRAALAALGNDLVALSGEPAGRRGAALLRQLSGTPPPAARLADLADVPAWLRRSRAEQRRLALRVALLSMAPTLARSIDGRWLGSVAEIAGEDLIDWAIAVAGNPDEGGAAPIPAETIEARGFALLRGQLPERLRGFIAGGEAEMHASTVKPWLDTALAAEAA